MTAYSTGVKSSELVGIRLSNIDTGDLTLRVNQGKGKKERYTVLPRKLVPEMREYYKWCRPKDFLFYGNRINVPIWQGTAGRVFQKAKKSQFT